MAGSSSERTHGIEQSRTTQPRVIAIGSGFVKIHRPVTELRNRRNAPPEGCVGTDFSEQPKALGEIHRTA